MMSDRWEYKIVQPDNPVSMKGKTVRANSESFLNRLGMDGWECYHVKTDDFPSIFYLKRRK